MDRPRRTSGWNSLCGHTVVGTYEDQGISGAKGRDKRPGLDRMLKDAVRRKMDMVAAWSVDRLGRSLVDLLGTPGRAAELALKHLHHLGHRKIAFLKGQEFSSDTEARWASIAKAARRLLRAIAWKEGQHWDANR